MRRQNENKAQKEFTNKKNKEPASPLKPPDKSKARGIVPIARIPINKGISETNPQ